MLSFDLQCDRRLRHNEKREKNNEGSKLSPELSNELRTAVWPFLDFPPWLCQQIIPCSILQRSIFGFSIA